MDGFKERPLHVLVVDDEATIRRTMSVFLETFGYRASAVGTFQEAVAAANRQSYDVAFVDLRLGASDGMDLIPALLSSSPWLKVIVMTAYASIDTAVEAMRRGASDYIPKPFTPDQARLALEKAAQVRLLEQRLDGLQEDLRRSNPEVNLSTRAPAMQRMLDMARQVAESDVTVLVRGESGTGKGIIARAIHGWSPRADKPFGVVSCPSIPADLLESELFGHVKGAFTGAVRDNPGRVAACQGGTLFLDEVGDLPPALQPKLLRFIQDRDYERVGDHRTRTADVRIVAATNISLEHAVKEGTFREDLFYRLNVVQLDLPPLRERREDIVPLAEHLLAFFGRARNRRFDGFAGDAKEALRLHDWPGNLRELRNAVERATIFAAPGLIGPDHLPESLTPRHHPPAPTGLTLQEIEEWHIRRVLASSKTLQEAAATLGIDQATLWRKRKLYTL